MTTLAENLQAVRDRIARASIASGRRPDAVRLLAVSKTFPPGRVEEAFAAGQLAFGENYVQEAVDKIADLRDRLTTDGAQAEWHFIGPIQSNKTRPIAENFAWVHSIERAKVAERLNAARPENMPPLQVCIQVNVSGEESKSGIAPGDERELARVIAGLPRLRLRGLMAIPEPTQDPAVTHERFALLRRLRDGLIADGYDVDTLSMGMSDDLETAIAEGATIVRVGTAIFGTRTGLPWRGRV